MRQLSQPRCPRKRPEAAESGLPDGDVVVSPPARFFSVRDPYFMISRRVNHASWGLPPVKSPRGPPPPSCVNLVAPSAGSHRTNNSASRPEVDRPRRSVCTRNLPGVRCCLSDELTSSVVIQASGLAMSSCLIEADNAGSFRSRDLLKTSRLAG